MVDSTMAVNFSNWQINFEGALENSNVFFQHKWDKIIDYIGEDPHIMWIYGTLIYTMSYYWLLGTLFIYFDITGRPKFLRKFKVQPGTNEPVEMKKLLNAVAVVFCNQIFVTGPISYLTFNSVVNVADFPPVRELPTLRRFFIDIIVCVIATEITFYYSHRLLHNKNIYKHVHKKHHEWLSPIAITAEYCHPIEHIFSNVFSVAIGVIIMKSHYLTALVWFTFALTTTMCHHSGYWMPLMFNPEFHDFHHLKFNYCYGVTGFLDKVHGTDVLFREFKAKKIKQK